jgi:hypothetical protein
MAECPSFVIRTPCCKPSNLMWCPGDIEEEEGREEEEGNNGDERENETVVRKTRKVIEEKKVADGYWDRYPMRYRLFHLC